MKSIPGRTSQVNNEILVHTSQAVHTSQQPMQAAFNSAMHKLLGVFPPKTLALSVSGGVDSMALAALSRKWATFHDVQLHAFVIDHHFRSESAKEAALVCDNLGLIGVDAKKLDLDMSLVPKSVLETRARQGRKDLLVRECNRQGITTVLQGHTLNDQIELFIMRQAAGSTWWGLAGTPQLSYLNRQTPPGTQKVQLARPLLGVQKAALIAFCKESGVPWVEDPSNMDPSLTMRNAVRKLLRDHGNALPDHLNETNAVEHVHLYSQRRTDAVRRARLVLDALKIRGSLSFNHKKGSAKLTMIPELLKQDLDVRTVLLHHILEQVSPVDVRSVQYRRSSIEQLFDLKNGTQATVWDVNVKRSGSTLSFKRSPFRRGSPSRQLSLGSEWSDWTLVDHRFWMRLRKDQEIRPIYLVTDTSGYKTSLRSSALEVFGDIPPLADLLRIPVLVWDDKGELEPANIAGFPTLGLVKGLEVECKFASLPL